MDIVPIALGEGGEWTMANQLYVKSGESPLVTLADWKARKQATLSKKKK